MTLVAGSTLGPYRIIEPVGRGGMASVFKAYEASLDRYVALKVLPPEFLHDPTFAERFRREAQTIARLEHPQIIPIFAYDIDAATGTPWMAMRLISGGSLSQRIKRGRLSATESARVLKNVADALDYAHSAGVIHRDVKPQNVLLDDASRVYLADFGIAKMVESTAHMTQTGMITGTPQYMAPEQALGKAIDKSIDIYALGIVAYELFTGQVPFSADTPVAVLMKQASEPMPLPPVSEVPEAVTRAILRATAKDPVARWPTASAFAGAIVSATTTAAAVAPTAVMAAVSEETVASLPVLGPVVSERKTPAPPARPKVLQVPPARSPGSGVGAAAVLGLSLVAAALAYVGYRYYASTSGVTGSSQAATTATPVGAVSPAASASPVPEPTPQGTALAATAPPALASPIEDASVAPTVSADPPRVPLTPAERRALLARGPQGRRERLEALAEARRRMGERGNPEAARNQPGNANAGVPTPRAARTRINLEIEASQPSTGAQVSALYAEVLIDNRPVRSFTIRFTGGNSFARWKRVENIVLEAIPLSAREITVAVAKDQGLNEERMEGSTRLALEGEETNLSVVVRFYNQYDKSVKFR